MRVEIRREKKKLVAAAGEVTVTAVDFGDGVIFPNRREGTDETGLAAVAGALRDLCAGTGEQVLSFEREKDEAWNRMLSDAGFVVHRRKLFVERDLSDLPEEDHPFTWRTLEEIGDAEFLHHLDRAAEGDPFEDPETRDPEREWQDLLAHAGDHLDRDLWKVAHVDGEPVGVVLPQSFGWDPPEGTLSYVGILPEHRGRGLGRRLHRAGLGLLKEAGIPHYKGSTDERNAPMARVFERNDCEVTAVQLYFRV